MQPDLDPRAPDTDALLVLLPGAEMQATDFAREGLIARARAAGVQDAIHCATIGYAELMAQSVVSTLHEQVILPAQARGYRRIRLAGISLGALNALLYASEHGAALAGLVLLSPYPGTRDILNEITRAGGPQPWAASPAAAGGDERVIWRWLAACAAAQHWPCPIWSATGSEDRFIAGQRQLFALLPPGRALELPGRHDWPAWHAQWDALLAAGAFTDRAA